LVAVISAMSTKAKAVLVLVIIALAYVLTSGGNDPVQVDVE
jgi:hypothetical protein